MIRIFGKLLILPLCQMAEALLILLFGVSLNTLVILK